MGCVEEEGGAIDAVVGWAGLLADVGRNLPGT